MATTIAASTGAGAKTAAAMAMPKDDSVMNLAREWLFTEMAGATDAVIPLRVRNVESAAFPVLVVQASSLPVVRSLRVKVRITLVVVWV